MEFTFLCSGVTLGVYIPALVLNKQFNNKGWCSDMVVLEELFLKDKKDKLTNTKTEFHRNFNFALMAQKVSCGINSSFDQLICKELITKWKKENRKKFLVFSGYWIPIIELFITQVNYSGLEIYICHMDVTYSASWRTFTDNKAIYKHLWMFSIEKNIISSFIDISEQEPIPFEKRKKNILIHGGGWGIGTYQNVIPEVNNKDIPLDIIVYDYNDFKIKNHINNYYLLDPLWKAWEKDEKLNYTFPPLGTIMDDHKPIDFVNNKKYSEVFNIIRRNRAIISKPGGATLIDSLASATPIIFLDPFGTYEAKNAELWQNHNLGISFADWKKSNYSNEILKNIHQNILNKRKDLMHYIDNFHGTRILKKIR